MNKTIIIEGNIATGKSLFLETLSSCPFTIKEQAQIFPEPLEKWTNVGGHNLFGHFGRNPRKYSFSFESYVLLTMVENHTKALNEGKSIRFLERSIYSAQEIFVQNLFNYGVLKPVNYKILKGYYDYFVSTAIEPRPYVIIYLKCQPEELLARIKSRGRDEEKDVNLKYLKNIEKLYDSLMAKFETEIVPVFTINTQKPKIDTIKDFQSLIHTLNLEISP